MAKKKKYGGELPQYPDGGMTPEMYNALKYYQGQQNNPDRQFLMDMSNSPLFQDRAAKMIGWKSFGWTDEDYENMRGDIQKNISDLHFIPTDNPYPMMPSAQGVYQEGLTDAERENMHFLNYMKDAPLTQLFPKNQALTEQIADYYGIIDKNPHSVFYKPGEDVVRLHEGSHGSTRGLNPEYWDDKLGRILPSPEKVTKTGGDFMYLSNPTEQKARVDVMRKMMLDNKLYDPINEEFQEKHYQNLQQYLDKNKENIKTNNPDLYEHIKQSYDIYDKDNFIRLMNSFVQNDSKNNPMTNQQVQYAAYGGPVGSPGDPKKKKKAKDLNVQDQFYIEGQLTNPYAGKSYHAYPAAQEYKDYVGSDKPPFERTFGDKMYDLFHKTPRVVTTFADGGPINPPIKTDDPNDPRLHAYLDSANLYNAYQKQLELNPPMDPAHWKKTVNADFNPSRTTGYYHPKEDLSSNSFSRDDWYFGTGYWGTKESGEPLGSPEDRALTEYYENELSFKEPASIGFWGTPDVGHSSINPIGSYYGGHYNPVYKKPVQPVEYTGDMADVYKNRYKVGTVDSEFGSREAKIKSPRLKDLMADAGDSDYSFTHRKEIAKSLGIDNYTGSLEQNKILKDYYKGGGDKTTTEPKQVPTTTPVTNTTTQQPVNTPVQSTPNQLNMKEYNTVRQDELVPRRVYTGRKDANGNPIYEEQYSRIRFAYGGPTDPENFKKLLAKGYNSIDYNGKEIVYPDDYSSRRLPRFGIYDDMEEEITEISKGDPTYKEIKSVIKPVYKDEFKTAKKNARLDRKFPEEDYYTGTKDYVPSKEFIDRLNYQKAQIESGNTSKMGDTDMLQDIILRDMGIYFDQNPSRKYEYKVRSNLAHSPLWYAADALEQEGILGVDKPKKAHGGMTTPQYEAEKGEVVDGGIPIAFSGGSITPNSMTSGKINGQTHEQGGVDMAGGKRVFSDRLYVDSNFLKDLDI